MSVVERYREQAERVRWWAVSTPDPKDRERLEAVARDYEEMAHATEGPEERLAD